MVTKKKNSSTRKGAKGGRSMPTTGPTGSMFPRPSFWRPGGALDQHSYLTPVVTLLLASVFAFWLWTLSADLASAKPDVVGGVMNVTSDVQFADDGTPSNTILFNQFLFIVRNNGGSDIEIASIDSRDLEVTGMVFLTEQSCGSLVTDPETGLEVLAGEPFLVPAGQTRRVVVRTPGSVLQTDLVFTLSDGTTRLAPTTGELPINYLAGLRRISERCG